MIRAAARQGTTTIACTPHLYEMDAELVERVRRAHREVAAAVEDAAIPVRLLRGFEVDLTVAATSDMSTIRSLCIQSPDGTKGVEASPAPGSPDALEGGYGRALVIEMPFSNWPPFFEETVRRLAANGFLPIIAHPERNQRVQDSPDVLTGCLNAGAILQGTSGSFSPLFRRDCQKTFFELLARGWFSLLASDAHSEPEYTLELGPAAGRGRRSHLPRGTGLARAREPDPGVGRKATHPHCAEAVTWPEPAQVHLSAHVRRRRPPYWSSVLP